MKTKYATVAFRGVSFGMWDVFRVSGGYIGMVESSIRPNPGLFIRGSKVITLAQLHDISLFMGRRERSRK